MGIESIISNIHLANNTYGTKNVKDTKVAKESEETKASKEAGSVHLSATEKIEELVKMVEDFNYQFVSDTTKTEAEKGLGTVIDF